MKKQEMTSSISSLAVAGVWKILELMRKWEYTCSTCKNLYIYLRLVFTSDGVIDRVVLRSVERYDLVKIKLTESEAEH